MYFRYAPLKNPLPGIGYAAWKTGRYTRNAQKGMARMTMKLKNHPPVSLNQWRRHRWAWKWLWLAIGLGLAALYLFNASIPGRRLEGCPAECAAAPERRPGPLRVASLNMLHGFPDFKNLPLRIEVIAAEIRRLDADVVLLQEVPWTLRTGNGAAVLARRLGYNHLYYRAEGNKYLIFFETGQAILSRFPLKDPHFTDLAPQVNLFESRVALSATALTPWGEATFVDTHLTNLAAQKNLGQAGSLLAFVKALPAGLKLVAGDFNAREDSPQIRLLPAAWIDAFRELHPDEPGLTCCIDDLNAGPEEPLEERIDYQFLAGTGGRIVRAELVFNQPADLGGAWQWSSDHIGLLVELEW
jgi:endonuclease/exonuclease/phosphatase family metal-dependent hydrolase